MSEKTKAFNVWKTKGSETSDENLLRLVGLISRIVEFIRFDILRNFVCRFNNFNPRRSRSDWRRKYATTHKHWLHLIYIILLKENVFMFKSNTRIISEFFSNIIRIKKKKRIPIIVNHLWNEIIAILVLMLLFVVM